MIARSIVVSTLVLLVSCGPRQQVPKEGVFDVDGFLNGQVNQLSAGGVTLSKHAGVDGIESDSTLVPTKARWTKELEIFRQLNLIQSTLYGDTYQREDLEDPRSNLKIQRYRSTAAPLRELRLYYQDNLQHVRRLEGEVVEENPVYSSGRTLSLEVEELAGHLMLSEYHVVGYQKLALRDTANYLITGSIHW